MDYAKMKVSELRELAEAQGLRNLKGVKKSELVELLKNIDKMKSQNQVEKTESFEQPEVEGKEVEGTAQPSAPQEVAEGILEVLSDSFVLVFVK